MRSLLVLAAALLCITPVYAETLVTASYVVVIIRNDPEGTVTSDNVTYVGVNRRNGDTIKIKGSTLHTMEPDGVTPNKFLGYKFENNHVSYFVGLDGTLRVTAGKKALLDESGKWLD